MDKLKRIDKNFISKEGKCFLPVTHESLVLDNDGLSVDEKYLTIADAQDLVLLTDEELETMLNQIYNKK